MRAPRLLGAPLAAVVFAAALAVLASGIRVSGGGLAPPFFIDEAHKLGEAYYWHLLAERRDLRNPDWTGDFYARTNPPVAKYVFGAALSLGGYHVRDRQLEDDFTTYWRQPLVLREKVPDGMLRISRGTSALFGAMICTVLFVAGNRLGGSVVGLAAATLFLAHPVVLQQARLGLTDTILIFFTTLALPVTMGAASRLRDRRDEKKAVRGAGWWTRLALRIVALPGLVAGLAAGTKLTGALAGVAYALGLLAAAAACDRPPRLLRIGAAAVAAGLAGLLAVAVFVAINPYYHHETLARIADILRVYGDWTVKQQVDPGGGLFGIDEKIAAVGQFSLRSATLPLALLLGPPGVWLTTLGFTLGSAHLVAWSLPRRRERGHHPRQAGGEVAAGDAASSLAWVLVILAGMTLWLPLAWTRYLLAPYATVSLVTAVGLARLPFDLRAVARSLRPATPASFFASRGGIAAAVIATTVVWLGLTTTSRVIAPELLSPDAPTVNDSREQRERHRAALRRATGDSIVLTHNRATLLAREGRFAEAAALLEQVVDRSAREESNATARDVRRSVALAELARLRTATGDRAGAEQALRLRVEAVRALRDGMHSADPEVRSSYDELIAGDERKIRESYERPGAPW